METKEELDERIQKLFEIIGLTEDLLDAFTGSQGIVVNWPGSLEDKVGAVIGFANQLLSDCEAAEQEQDRLLSMIDSLDYCPFCDRIKSTEGHASGCPRQQALAGAGAKGKQ